MHKTTGRSTPPLRSRSGTVTPTSNNATLGIAPQAIQVKGVDNKLVQLIMDEIVEGGARVRWSDIAGQEVIYLHRERITLMLKCFLNVHFCCHSGCKASTTGNGYTAISKA